MKLAAKELPLLSERLVTGSSLKKHDLERLKASAEQAAKVLGDLRGLALKVGQTMSYVDGLLPSQATEAYQKALAKLQSGAPTVSLEQLRVELERGLGRPMTEAFVEFEEKPVAAASIGQVHRAWVADPSRPDGRREVAVKVQYPGIAQALGSDLKNLELLRPVVAMLAPGADTGGGMSEVVERIAEELDYLHEADSQEHFRKLLGPYPDVMVPEVLRSHCGPNVLTTDFIRGSSLRQVADEGSQELRNRVGVAIFRFTLGTAFAHGVFNTDPHPGNYLVRDDGVTAFLDFGSVKYLPREIHARWRELAELLVSGQTEEWRRRSSLLLGMEHMDPRARELHQQYMLYTSAVVSKDQTQRIDKELLRGAVDEGIATARKVMREVGVLPSKAKTMKIPPDMVMIARLQVGLFAVLAQLRPEANWNQVLREMLDSTRATSAR